MATSAATPCAPSSIANCSFTGLPLSCTWLNVNSPWWNCHLSLLLWRLTSIYIPNSDARFRAGELQFPFAFHHALRLGWSPWCCAYIWMVCFIRFSSSSWYIKTIFPLHSLHGDPFRKLVRWPDNHTTLTPGSFRSSCASLPLITPQLCCSCTPLLQLLWQLQFLSFAVRCSAHNEPGSDQRALAFHNYLLAYL